MPPRRAVRVLMVGSAALGNWELGEPHIPPIPEPAGLGLIGLALIALRTKRR